MLSNLDGVTQRLYICIYHFHQTIHSKLFLQFLNEKTYGRETATDKEKTKKFQWTEGMIEYLLDSLKRSKLVCNFSRIDFDAEKTVQNSKLWKEIAKEYEVLLQLKLLLTQELIYQFSRRRNLGENKITKQSHWHGLQ